MNCVPPTTVLLYHEILPAGELPNADIGCIPWNIFLDHLEALERAGFENVSLATALDIATNHRGNSTLPGRPTYAVTFDDGYQNLHRFLPRVVERIKPTVFLIEEYLGKSNLVWNTRAPLILKHMDAVQLNELQVCGVELQTHGPDHHNLLKFEAAELRTRFERNRAWFHKCFGRVPQFTAYPYGACNETIKQVAAEFFVGAVSVNHGAWQGSEARYALNRISIPAYFSGQDLVDVILTAPQQRWVVTEQRAPWRRSEPSQ